MHPQHKLIELYKQALTFAYETLPKDPANPMTDQFQGLVAEKLAELVVLACADICMELSAKCAGLPYEGALAIDCANLIKQDFGIE